MLNLDTTMFEFGELTSYVNRQPFKPGLAGTLFQNNTSGISVTTALIDQQDGVLEIVNDVARGSAPQQATAPSRQAPVALVAKHMPLERVINASDFQGVRVLGSDNELETLESVRNRYLDQMLAAHAITLEQQRVDAIKGTLTNSATGPVDLYAKFGKSRIEVEMELDTAGVIARDRVIDFVEAAEEELGALSVDGYDVICGTQFFRSLVEHKSVKESFARWQEGAALRGDMRSGFSFAGANFVAYRGSIGGQKIIGDHEAYVCPRADIYNTRFSPADMVEAANTIGLPSYSKAEEMPYGRGIKLLVESNPISWVSRPQAIIKLHRHKAPA